jgi:hypothetical protein
MAGRKAGFRHHEDTRKKIQAQLIINRLQDHVKSATPLMDASQVNAARALLNKVLPDLSAVEMEHGVTNELAELLKAIDGKTRGIPTSR